MSRFTPLLVLLPCLSLVCCDKHGGTVENKDSGLPEKRASRVRQSADREKTQPSQEATEAMPGEVAAMDSAAREKELANIAWNAMETDPALASKTFLQLSKGSAEKIRLIRHYAMRTAEYNVQEALAWAHTLESKAEVSAACCQIAMVMAEKDPVAAANLLSESGMPGREMDVAVVQVVQRWAAQSPSDTAAWLEMFSPGPAREASIKVVTEQWLPRDAAAAFAWLDTLDEPVIRTEIARAMEGVILQQPDSVREAWLQHADAEIQSELEQQRALAIQDVGSNIPHLPPNGE